MGSWYDYVKEFEQAAENDKHGLLFTVHFENMKKVFYKVLQKNFSCKNMPLAKQHT